MKPNFKANIAFLFITIIWGSNFVVNKYIVNLHVPPLQISAIRYLISGVLFLFFFIVLKKEKLPNLKQFKWLTCMGILVFILSSAISNIALKYIPSGLTAIIAALYPLTIILIDHFIYKNIKINLTAIIGIFLGLIGLSFVCINETNFSFNFQFWMGIILSFIAMISWSISTILLSSHHFNLNKYYSVGWQMAISGLILFIWLHFFSDPIPLNSIPIKAWSSIAYLILVSSIFAFIAFIYAMNHFGVSNVSLYAYINPIVTIFIAFIWIKEPLSENILLGSFITLLGVYLVNKSLKKQRNKIIEQTEIIEI